MSTRAADDVEAIAQRMRELSAERTRRIMGKPIEPVEAPKDIDWAGFMGHDYDPA